MGTPEERWVGWDPWEQGLGPDLLKRRWEAARAWCYQGRGISPRDTKGHQRLEQRAGSLHVGSCRALPLMSLSLPSVESAPLPPEPTTSWVAGGSGQQGAVSNHSLGAHPRGQEPALSLPSVQSDPGGSCPVALDWVPPRPLDSAPSPLCSWGF